MSGKLWELGGYARVPPPVSSMNIETSASKVFATTTVRVAWLIAMPRGWSPDDTVWMTWSVRPSMTLRLPSRVVT